MKQTIYLIRHAEPNYNNHQYDERELTAEGLQDCQLLLDYFKDISIDRIYSSPFKRALQTIDELAKEKIYPSRLKRTLENVKLMMFGLMISIPFLSVSGKTLIIN